MPTEHTVATQEEWLAARKKLHKRMDRSPMGRGDGFIVQRRGEYETGPR